MEEFFQKLAMGALTVFLGVLAWVWNRQDGRLSAVEANYMTKTECDKMQAGDRTDIRELGAKMDMRFDQVFKRLNDLQKESNDRYDKLRDLMDRRHLDRGDA